MPTPESIGFDTGKIIDEVVGKIESFETKYSEKIAKDQTYWDIYKGKLELSKTSSSNQLNKAIDGVSKSSVSELTRAVDNLATTRYRMIMAQDPPFQALAQRDDISEHDIYKIESLLSFQLEKTGYKRGLRDALASLELLGTVIIEEPWMTYPVNSNKPYWEGVGFVPRPLNQAFFTPSAMSIESADWIGTTDIVTKYRLKMLSQNDSNETAWIHQYVDEALSETENEDSMPQSVKTKLMNSGYNDFKGNKTLDIYYGPLESQNSYEDWVVGIVNRKHLVRFHKPILEMRPFRVAYSTKVDQEALGIGAGQKTEHLVKMLNANRSRIVDVISFNVLSMFKGSRSAGIDQRDLRIKPFGVVWMDDMAGLERLSPDINSANYAIKLEEMLKDEIQGLTGATKNLQAVTTEATATEASLVMNETMRRISVDTEIMAEPLLREHLYYMHKMNLRLLDRPIWLNVTGEQKPVRLLPDDINREVDFKIKITTDKDFRPQRVRRLIELIQVITSVRQQIPAGVNFMPLIDEATRALGIDPKKLQPPTHPLNIAGIPLAPQLTGGTPLGGQMASLAGLINKEQGLAEAGAVPNLPMDQAENMKVGL